MATFTPAVTDDRDIIPLSRFNAVLGRVRGSRRMQLILDDPDPAARVAAMPVQDLYFLIKEVGLADSEEIVALATPEQFQGMLDLDSWDKDRFQDAEVRPWLRALLAAGPEKFTHVWAQLDQELTALILKRWTRIYNLAEEDVPEDEEPPFYPTPDRFFMVKITAEHPDDVLLVEQILDRIYRVDQVQARHTLRAAQSEPFADLEELSYRWRSGRLQDLGYADYYEALEVYRPIDLPSIRIGEGTIDPPSEATAMPIPLADPALRQPFLARVLEKVLDADEAKKLESALVLLFNRVLSADRVDPGDPEAAAAGSARAAATVSIGLETLSRGDVELGVQAIRTISLTRLHRAGHTVTLQLGKLARTLQKRAVRADEPYASVIAALAQRRPAFPSALDEPPGVEARPFKSVADVRGAVAVMGELAAQITFVHDVVKADPVALGPALTLGTVGRTALVNGALGRGVVAEPLSRKDLEAFLGRPASERAALAEAAARAAAGEKGVRLPQEFPAVVQGWMGDLDWQLVIRSHE